MQSTKEEYHFTKTFLSQQEQQQQLSAQRQQWLSPSQQLTSSDLEKLLVVLLVAFGTVCLLTNLLVLAILIKLRERGTLPFRYRLIISQALTGIITSAVLVYPLKILSLLLVDFNTSSSSSVTPSASPHQINLTFFTSQSTCLFLCSAPLVFSTVSSCLHAVLLYMEQAVRHFSSSNYKVLVSGRHQKFLTFLAATVWIPPFALACLPAFGRGWLRWMGDGNDFCGIGNLWTVDYSNAVLSTYLFLSAMLVSSGVAIKLAGRFARKRNFSTTKWSRRQGGFEDNLPLCPGSGNVANHPKRRYKATLIIRTVEPTPLDLSHSKESILNFIGSVLLTLPALLHYSNYFGEVPLREEDNTVSSMSMMESSFKDERWISLTHLLVIINGAFAPVLHLLSDDVLCGLGLEMLNKVCDSLFSATNVFDIGDVTKTSTSKNVTTKSGVDNDAFDEKESEENEKSQN